MKYKKIPPFAKELLHIRKKMSRDQIILQSLLTSNIDITRAEVRIFKEKDDTMKTPAT